MPGGLAQADEAGIERGEKWLRGIGARGGTELDGAMGQALELIRKHGEAAGRVPVVVLLTDGQVGDESSVLRRLQKELGDARVFTLGIDTAVNDGFLKRLASLGGGTSTFVEPGARLEEALQAIGREIGAPLITDLRVEGGLEDPAPSRVPDLFAGRASSAFFRVRSKGKVTVTGRYDDGKPFSVEIEPREAPLAAIDHLWARARVTDLEDQFRETHDEAVKKEIIALSLRHMLLTRFTAFVVIDESEAVNKAGPRRTVVQPVEEAAEWTQAPMTMATGGMRAMAAMPSMIPSPGAPVMMGRAPRAKKEGFLSKMAAKMSDAFSGSGLPPPARPAAADTRTSVATIDTTGMQKALEAYVRAFAHAHAELKAGRLPPADPLREARMKLMEELKLLLEFALLVPALQKFLRSAAQDLIAALSSPGATPAQIAPLFEQHAPTLQAALAEARMPFGATKAPAGSFWESSI
jgi:Ca-activated chloride channel family protein